MKNVYAVLAYYNHTHGVTKVSTNWRYVAALNCYRVLSGKDTHRTRFPALPPWSTTIRRVSGLRLLLPL